MPSAPSHPLPPEVTDDAVRWRIPRSWAPDGVRFEVDWSVGQDLDFAADGDWWTYLLARPAAWRLEYRLELRGGDGLGLDPTNPRRVPNPFGDRSEIRFPDYRPPAWLSTTASSRAVPLDLPAGPLAAPIPARVWSPPWLADDRPAPVLIAHDGSGMAQSGSLLSWATAYAGARSAGDDRPRGGVGVAPHRDTAPLRVCLLDAADGLRDEWYSDNPDYADALTEIVIPALRDRFATSAVAGLGASLGAVAMLSWHRRHPGVADALALQSGSFFTTDLDPQESGYPAFARVCAATEAATAEAPDRRIPLVMTCGAIEENLANNRSMAARLASIGYPVEFAEVPDAHTMIGWRDAWTPHLTGLLASVGQ